MRIIKFRGKSLETGEWVTGSYVNATNEPYIIVEYGTSPKYVHRVDPETVGQFTGKYDKNNDEIYKGHILKYENPQYPNHKPYVVRWSEEDCCFECVNKDNFMLPSVWKDMEIIGNVIENSEFLEGD